MGKAAAACCVYEESGQGSFEEGAWRDRGRAVSRTSAGDERWPNSTALITFPCQHPRSSTRTWVYLHNGNVWTCLTKRLGKRPELGADELGSRQIAWTAIMCQKSWHAANLAYPSQFCAISSLVILKHQNKISL